MPKDKQTQLITAGRKQKWTKGVVNPPVQRASTIVFETVADKRHATINRGNKELFTGDEAPTPISLSKTPWQKSKVAQVVRYTHVAPQR